MPVIKSILKSIYKGQYDSMIQYPKECYELQEFITDLHFCYITDTCNLQEAKQISSFSLSGYILQKFWEHEHKPSRVGTVY